MTDQIYHVVDGKVVPKPGNKRDPKRRYSSYNGKTIEYTPEEEAARDEEEAKWEADLPLREAKAKEHNEQHEKFKESLYYKEKVVAFLDILGWRKAIKKSATDPEFTKKLGLLLNAHFNQQKVAEMNEEYGIPGDFQATHFSDSIVLSVEPDSLYSLLSLIKTITLFLIMNGFLIRGGITSGEIYHQGGTVFGPAIIEAYDLEKVEENPRIIINDTLSKVFGQGVKHFDKDGSLLGFGKTWRKDDEGQTFLDFFQPMGATTYGPPNIEWLKAFLEPAYDLVSTTLKIEKDEKIKKKHLWLAKYYNSILDEYPGTGLNKVDI